MRLIDRYIFRQVLTHSLLGLGIFTFVFFVPQLVRLMDLIVRHSAPWPTLGLLFVSTFPAILGFTLPIGVLLGVLIALGRLSADSELIAMTALGMGRRRLLLPVGLLALGSTLLAFLMTLWLAPLSARTYRTIENRLRAGQASFQVTPRVFDERFPGLILYVNDVEAAATRWSGVFLAVTGTREVSRLTFAEEAIVIADRTEGKLDLHMRNGSVHEFSSGKPEQYSLSAFAERDWPVELRSLQTERITELPIPARSTVGLMREYPGEGHDVAVELHRRFAFPLACAAFALLAIPLGARPRRGGRAAGFLITLLLICSYYLMFTIGVALARRGAAPIWAGVWLANIATAALALFLLPRLERMPGDSRLSLALAGIKAWRIWNRPRRPAPVHEPVKRAEPAPAAASVRRWRSELPMMLDLYLLRSFLFYFALMTVAFILLFEVFTFFELVNDIAQHRTSLLDVFNYFKYLAFHLFYQLAPLAALVAVLVTLGVMSKNNELVAFKAAGISLYRLALPLLLAGLFLAAGLVVLDDTYLPYANRRQDALRNQIKGRPSQTYFQPRRQWIFGENSKVYNYQLFDPDRQLFGELNVFELVPETFQLRRRIYAARAHWEPQQRVWILESGWVRSFENGHVSEYAPFVVNALAELNEPPSYFNREVRQYNQMTWLGLRQYIQELSQAGFDVARLSVQLHRKLSFPLIAPIIILLAIPFSIMVGTRGAIGGLALGVGIAVVYWAASALTEAMGAVGQLPPAIAGWSPDVIFGFVGLYFFFKMPT